MSSEFNEECFCWNTSRRKDQTSPNMESFYKTHMAAIDIVSCPSVNGLRCPSVCIKDTVCLRKPGSS